VNRGLTPAGGLGVDLGLTGQAAVVAGAARGIGRAVAEAFAEEGAHVALLDRDSAVRETAAEIADRTRVRTLAAVADITDFAAVSAAAAEFTAHLGRVDHVVVAAAVGSGKFGFPFWNLAPADWERVLRVNVVGAVTVATAFAPLLAAQRSGTMLFLASVAGQNGSQTDPPYSASKAAVINFAQCAARDLAPHGVRVNALCPGMVDTALNRSVWEAWCRTQPEGDRLTFEEWAGEKVQRVVPLARWQKPEDIAAMAVFLASARAANVTGQTINVDGGYVMR
jgi:NAD(P)-dependent dehydrogenase (short-subunit alcohol dehydrogenase family)